VQIGHNCSIGRHNLLVSQVAIGGSSSTGDYVVIAGQTGVVDHVHLGDRVVVGASSGVARDVPAGQVMLGVPALPVRDQKRILVTLERLPEMNRDLRRIKRHLGLDAEDAPPRREAS
jgi:UDP-3-O-[3-hydroxymyristoyl] glucosamine N-acyltransferase